MDVAEIGIRVNDNGAVVTLKQIGKATDELTEAEKRQNAILRQLAQANLEVQNARKMERTALAGLTAAQREQARVVIEAQGGMQRYLEVQRAMTRETQAASRATTQNAVTVAAMGTAAQAGHLSVGRLGNSFASLATSMVGVHPIAGNILGVLGNFAVGSTLMVGVLAGVAALSFAYNRLTADTRKLAEETDKAIDRLRNLKREQQGSTFGISSDLDLANARIAESKRRLGIAQSFTGGEANPSGDPGFGPSPAQIAAQKKLIADLNADIAAGERERNAIIQRGADNTRNTLNSDLATLIKHGVATAKQRADALALLRAYQTDVNRLGVSDLSGRAALVGQIETLNDALFPKTKTDQATGALKNFNEELERRARLAAQFATEEEARTARLAKGIADLIRAQHEAATERLGLPSDSDLHKDIGRNVETALEPMKRAAEQAKQIQENFIRSVQDSFSQFFVGIFNGGLSSFSKLFDSIRQLFLKLIADMLAAQLVQKLISVLFPKAGLGAGAQMLSAGAIMKAASAEMLLAAGIMKGAPVPPGAGGVAGAGLGGTLIAGAGIAIAGGGVGYGLGRLAGGAAGGAALGAIGGAATGAAIGSLGGPIGVATGAILGGLAGLAGGLLGGGAAAREHAAALKAAMEANRAAMEDFHAAATGTTGSLEELIRKVHETAAALRAQTAAAMPHGGWGNSPAQNAAYAAAIAQIAADEAAYVARLAEEDRLKKQYFKEDLQVRLLRAQGHEAEANAMALKLQQEREYAAAVAAGADAQTLALLQTVQAAEVLKKAMDGLNTTVRNAPSGFKIESYINRFAAARPWGEPPLGMPYSPQGGPTGTGGAFPSFGKTGYTPPGQGEAQLRAGMARLSAPKATTTINIGTVTLALPPGMPPEKVGPAFMTYIRKVQLQTVGPNAPLADAMEYAS